VEPLLIPTILTSYMLVHKYIIQNHPPSLSTNMYEGTILHSIHTARGAPFPIQTLAKQYSHSPSPTSGKQWSHRPSPLWASIAPIAHPQPRGNLWTHSPSPLTLSSPKLQQWANDPTWTHLGGCNLHPPILGPWASDPWGAQFWGVQFWNPPFWAHLGSLAHFRVLAPSGSVTYPYTNGYQPMARKPTHLGVDLHWTRSLPSPAPTQGQPTGLH